VSATTAANPPLDKARVTTLVDKEGAVFYRRLRRLKGVVRAAVVDNDALDIATGSAVPETLATPDAEDVPEPPSPPSSGGPRDRIAAFLEWFRSAIETLLVGAAGAGLVAAGGHYTAKWIDSAFSSGWRAGALALSRSGRDVSVPQSMDAVSEEIAAAPTGVRNRRRALRSNQREQLAELATDVADEVGAVVRESIERGRSRRRAATAINDRIEAVGVTRARQIAAYELADAHNRAIAERYRTRGVFEVRVYNPDPCPEICAEKVGPTYSIREAVRGELCPFHPWCQGVLLPT
jgi:hypothetical protein